MSKDASDNRTCEKCGYVLSPFETNCPKCARLAAAHPDARDSTPDSPDSPQHINTVSAMTPEIRCTHCDAENYETDRVCQRCGMVMPVIRRIPSPLQQAAREDTDLFFNLASVFTVITLPGALHLVFFLSWQLIHIHIPVWFPLPFGIAAIILGTMAGFKGDRRAQWVILFAAVALILNVVIVFSGPMHPRP